MAENVNNAYAGVTEIVFQNNRFPLNGASVDDVLALLMYQQMLNWKW